MRCFFIDVGMWWYWHINIHCIVAFHCLYGLRISSIVKLLDKCRLDCGGGRGRSCQAVIQAVTAVTAGGAAAFLTGLMEGLLVLESSFSLASSSSVASLV